MQERVPTSVTSPAVPAAISPTRLGPSPGAGAYSRSDVGANPGNRGHLVLAPRQGIGENTTSRFRAGAMADPWAAISHPGGLNRSQGKPGAMPKAVFASPATVGCTFAVPILWPEIDLCSKRKPVRQSFCAVSVERPGVDTRLSSARGASGAF